MAAVSWGGVGCSDISSQLPLCPIEHLTVVAHSPKRDPSCRIRKLVSLADSPQQMVCTAPINNASPSAPETPSPRRGMGEPRAGVSKNSLRDLSGLNIRDPATIRVKLQRIGGAPRSLPR